MNKTTFSSKQFHYGAELGKISAYVSFREDTKFTYKFENFFHPYVGELIDRLNRYSLPGLFDPAWQAGLARTFFGDYYDPLPSSTVGIESFPKEIDLREGGPYANYNWELLFHVPLTIAVHLSKAQRFAEAQRWFHYIFDPTTDDTSVPAPQRFWRFLEFRKGTAGQQVDELLALLAKPTSECSEEELEQRELVLNGYEAIKAKPFQPHAVARTRFIAYQYTVVMKYLDNLIAWGDSLFAQDTIETINEATQLYVLAANLLGPRPQQVPARGAVETRNFHQLKEQGLDATANALVDLEAQFPFNVGITPQGTGATGAASAPLLGFGRTLYFCIPRNDKLFGYWDTVADRLYKIRNCLNIEGVFRQLALFDPPIDPGMLVKAAAAGIDISSIVAGLNQPPSPVRAAFLIQKALEVASEVRGMGGSLLSALEKRDGERLALLRQSHEVKLQRLAQDVRFLQWKQAQESTEALLRTRANALERYRAYLRLLGLEPGDAAPDTLPLDRRELNEENFDEAYGALVEAYDLPVELQPYPKLKLTNEASPASLSGLLGSGKLYLNPNENLDLNILGPLARGVRVAGIAVDTVFGVLSMIPDVGVDFHYWGLGGRATVFGGSLFAGAGRFASNVLNLVATLAEGEAAVASKTATYERRADDWLLQANLAGRELQTIGRQLIGSLIAEQVAHHEYTNAQAQVAASEEVDELLHDKFTNEELYGWMQGELSRRYYEYYRFAVGVARQAERAMKRELMRPAVDRTDYVAFNYWDGGRKGLLAGEALHLDVKRMELAYHEHNRRELELTRHVSLRQLDPVALLKLKVTGSCEVTIPEWLYDRDCPGHYLRRIKSVALSIPAVVGPYTSLNCTLSLLKSSVRMSADLADGAYARVDELDDRIVDYVGSVEQIVTSGGSNDAGLFETNLRDERFLPFEGSGAVSTWRLSLPTTFRPFDYSTVADVVLHVRYTARQGGDLLGQQAIAELQEMVAEESAAGLALLFSVRHDFPTEWAAFVAGDEDLSIQLRRDHFPYFADGYTIVTQAVELYAAQGDWPDGRKLARRTVAAPQDFDDELNGAGTSTVAIPPDNAVLPRASTSDAFLVVRYGLER